MRPYGVRWRPRLTRPVDGPMRPSWAEAGTASAKSAVRTNAARGRGVMAADGSLPPSPMPASLTRLGLVVHPTRDLEPALGTLREWATGHGAEVTQIETVPGERRIAPLGEASDADAIVAVGGDGTVLAALRVAADAGRPVLGVACGSLGALAAVAPDRITDAMDRIAGGDCDTVALPALEVTPSTGDVLRALNDLVIVRAGAGQVRVEAWLDGALYARWAGDGLILATALGSSAYTLAAGGPLLAPPATGTVLTALASHGGCIPSL